MTGPVVPDAMIGIRTGGPPAEPVPAASSSVAPAWTLMAFAHPGRAIERPASEPVATPEAPHPALLTLAEPSGAMPPADVPWFLPIAH